MNTSFPPKDTDECYTGRHDSCRKLVQTEFGYVECDCACHDDQAPQVESIVGNLKRSGVRPGTVADLRRFEQRMAEGKLGR